MNIKDIKSPFQLLSYSTTRIRCILKNGYESTGTGFFLYLNDFKNGDNDGRPILVTNKHVIKNAEKGFLTLSTIIKDEIQPTKHIAIPFSNFESFWHPHPDEDIDLCFLNFKLVEQMFMAHGEELFYMALPLDKIATDDDIESFDFVENVIMIGYPNGIWDSFNNKPIFRKGITATNLKLDYENKPEFLIDMAVFGGSSGSPILIVDQVLKVKDGEAFPVQRVFLVGILYAGFQHVANGKIKVVEIPQMQQTTVRTQIPNNLGIVIKAKKLLDFRRLFYGPDA